MQGLYFVERSEPIVYCLFVALRKKEVRVVVDAISSDDQSDGRYIQRSCVGRVGVAEVHDLELFALKIKGISFEDSGRCQLRRNLAWKARFPE